MIKNNSKASIVAGIIAGAVFLLLEMIMVPVFMNGSPWAPPRMIAAIAMGKEVLPSPENPPTFDFTIFLVAMVIHFILSIIYAIIIGWLCRSRTMGISIAIGAGFGLAIYFINFYGFTTLFPWFAMARNWVSVFAHLVFGITTAWAFKTIQKRKEGAVPIKTL